MCNVAHEGGTLIPETGRAWKIFQPVYSDTKGVEYRGLMGFSSRFFSFGGYEEDLDGWINWKQPLALLPGVQNQGFCCFMRRDDAKDALIRWVRETSCTHSRHEVVEIEYTGGMQEHWDDDMFSSHPVLIALVRRFRRYAKPGGEG